MKRKHKMNIGLAFFVVALFVVSSGMSAMGNVVQTDVEKENSEENAITMNSGVTLDCGSIRVNGKPGSYPDVDYSCSAKDHSSVDVGSGCSVTVKVSYHLWAGGDDDKATARIWFTDKPSDKATFTTPNNNNVQEGTLQLTKYMDDSRSYDLKLEVEWRDYITTANILVGGVKPSDTATVKTTGAKPHLTCSTTSLYLYGDPAQAGGTLRRSDAYNPAFKIDNDGGSGTTLRVQATAKRTSGEQGSSWSMDPSSLSVPADVLSSVELEVTGLPRCQKYLFRTDEEKKIYGEITLTNLDDPSNTITIPVTVHVKYKSTKSKSIETAPLLLSNLLQMRFPALFALLQSHPAFQ